MTRILLAEDDGDMRRFLVRALQNAGYDVVAFDNGMAAYERIREEPFGLLLTDIVMPGGMDGIELTRRLRKERPELKVLLMSGYPQRPGERGEPLPPDVGSLQKPFTTRELRARLERAFEGDAA